MPGTSTSAVEVINISQHGFWVLLDEREFFLPFEDYPWFREAKVSEILGVELFGEEHLHWPALDVDLSLSILENPEKYPLISKGA